MTNAEAIEILRAMQHAKELTTSGVGGLYGRIVTENTTKKEIEALGYAIEELLK